MRDRREDDVAELADAIQKAKGLVLFLGSGVNFGLVPKPLWHQFLGDLWNDAVKIGLSPMDRTDTTDRIAAWVYRSDIFSAYEKASIVKILLGRDRYHIAIRKILYNRPQGMHAVLLESIVNLCKSRWVRSILTFNYDEYLENALADSVRIPIHHVHGAVRNSFQASTDGAGIVLSMDEYFHNMAMPLSWQTTVQLHALINDACLFVGASLTDINMLRLLTYARDQAVAGRVFALLAREEFREKVRQEMKIHPVNQKELGRLNTSDWEREAVRFAVRSKVSLLNDLGVSVIFVENFNALPVWIDRLTQMLKLTGRK